MRMAGVLASLTSLVLTLLFVYRCTIATKTLEWGAYCYAEILIDYRAGLVRRGLLGALIEHFVHVPSSLHAVNLVVFCNFAVLTLGVFLLALLKARYKAWTAALVLLVPEGVFQMAFTREMFNRKEVFFFSFLAVAGIGLHALRRIPAGSAMRRYAAYGLIAFIWYGGVACSLIHEGYLFLAAPATMYLLVAAVRLSAIRTGGAVAGRARENRVSASFIGTIAFSFLLSATVFHGTAVQGATIWFHLRPGDLAILQSTGPGGIGSLSSGALDLLHEHIMHFQTGLAWWHLAPVALLFGYCSVLIGLNISPVRADGEGLLRWLRCFGILALGNLPIYFIGFDWGRWISSLFFSYLLVWLSVQDDELFVPLPRLRFNVMRGWLAKRGFQSLPVELASSAVRLVQRNCAATVSLLLLFALTFRLPELGLVESNEFIGSALAGFIVSKVHLVAQHMH